MLSESLVHGVKEKKENQSQSGLFSFHLNRPNNAIYLAAMEAAEVPPAEQKSSSTTAVLPRTPAPIGFRAESPRCFSSPDVFQLIQRDAQVHQVAH